MNDLGRKNLIAKEQLRLPELEPLTESEHPEVWFPVPGMYGGFGYVLEGEALTVSSFCRVAGGSGMTHRVTADGIELLERGWG